MSMPKVCSNSGTTPLVLPSPQAAMAGSSPLLWLLGEGGEQSVEAMLQQSLGGGHAAHLIEAEIEAVLADAEGRRHLRDRDRFLKVQPEVVPCLGHNLHRAVAGLTTGL